MARPFIQFTGAELKRDEEVAMVAVRSNFYAIKYGDTSVAYNKKPGTEGRALEDGRRKSTQRFQDKRRRKGESSP